MTKEPPIQLACFRLWSEPSAALHGWRKLALGMGLLLAASCGLRRAAAVGTNEVPSNGPLRANFRVGFSATMFTDVNENDAKAAIKVWAQMLFKGRDELIVPEPTILKTGEAITQAIRGQSVDGLILCTDEFWQLDAEQRAGPFIVGLNDGRITEEYVLLVARESQIERMEDLHGHSVILFQNSRMCLALPWLDTLLAQDGLPRTAEFCQLKRAVKPAKVVLPVFFRQADACVVTRRTFRTMSELNPQVSQRLKVLATSPGLVPIIFCFRRDYNAPMKDKIMAELAKIKASPTGAQLLTLFQANDIESQPISCLDSAFALLDTHQRLCGNTNSLKAATASTTLDGTKEMMK